MDVLVWLVEAAGCDAGAEAWAGADAGFEGADGLVAAATGRLLDPNSRAKAIIVAPPMPWFEELSLIIGISPISLLRIPRSSPDAGKPAACLFNCPIPYSTLLTFPLVKVTFMSL